MFVMYNGNQQIFFAMVSIVFFFFNGVLLTDFN